MTKDTSQIKDNSQMRVGTGPPSTFHQPPAGVGAGQLFPSVIPVFLVHSGWPRSLGGLGIPQLSNLLSARCRSPQAGPLKGTEPEGSWRLPRNKIYTSHRPSLSGPNGTVRPSRPGEWSGGWWCGHL